MSRIVPVGPWSLLCRFRTVMLNSVPVGNIIKSVTDQIIDAAMARALHADACRDHALVGWIVMTGPPDQPGKFTARPAADRVSPHGCGHITACGPLPRSMLSACSWSQTPTLTPPRRLSVSGYDLCGVHCPELAGLFLG